MRETRAGAASSGLRRAVPAGLVAVLAVATVTVAIPPRRAVASTSSATSTSSTTVGASGATGPTPASPAAPGVTLVSQPPEIETRGAEVLGLHLDDASIATESGAAVEITVHRSVTSRTDFDRAVSGESLPDIRSRLTFPFSSISVDHHGNFLVGFGLIGSGASRTADVDEAGVYPVEVGVVDAAQRSTFLTWMVVVDPANVGATQPLRVSWVWQLSDHPLHLPGDLVSKPVFDDMRPGGRLDHIATLLARARRFPITLGISPETLSGWIEEARSYPALLPGVTRVRRAAARESVQLLPEPYVPISGPTIEAEGLGTQVPNEYVTGENAMETATGELPDPRTAFVDPVDDATVNRLTQLLIGRYVVRDTALTPVVEPLTPAQPFTLTTANGSVAPAVATDSGLEQLVTSAGPPVLRVQRVLAGLAEVAYEAPSQARGVVLSTASNWHPDVPTVTLLLHDLANDPLVAPVTLDSLFAAVPAEQRDGVPLQRTLAPITTSGTRPLLSSDYEDATRALTAYSAMVGAHDPSVAEGHHALLLALSTSNSRPEALALLGTVEFKLRQLTAGITIGTKALTLTARRAEVPLSFQNDTKRANILVRVHLDSPKLIFPDGPDILLKLPLGHYTKRFPVEARASGTFTMTVTLESADGSLVLGPPTVVTIRSAVFSGIGIALTVGALLFLAGWWGNHYRRTRRSRRTVTS
jgi:hypothetical protein